MCNGSRVQRVVHQDNLTQKRIQTLPAKSCTLFWCLLRTVLRGNTGLTSWDALIAVAAALTSRVASAISSMLSDCGYPSDKQTISKTCFTLYTNNINPLGWGKVYQQCCCEPCCFHGDTFHLSVLFVYQTRAF